MLHSKGVRHDPIFKVRILVLALFLILGPLGETRVRADDLSSSIAKLAGSALVATQMTSPSNCNPPELSAEAVEVALKAGTVHIGFNYHDPKNKDLISATGSGFFELDENNQPVLITALHVLNVNRLIDPKHSFVLTNFLGQQVLIDERSMEITRPDPERDEIMIHFKNKNLSTRLMKTFKVLPTSDQFPEIGQPLTLAGFPPKHYPVDSTDVPEEIFKVTYFKKTVGHVVECHSTCPKVSTGPERVIQPDTHAGNESFCINAVVYPGNSGGPAVNSFGEVVGTVYAIDRCHTFIEPIFDH